MNYSNNRNMRNTTMRNTIYSYKVTRNNQEYIISGEREYSGSKTKKEGPTYKQLSTMKILGINYNKKTITRAGAYRLIHDACERENLM